MEFLTNEKLTIVGAAGMIGSNMAQTALMMKLTPNICLYDPYAPALEGVAERARLQTFHAVVPIGVIQTNVRSQFHHQGSLCHVRANHSGSSYDRKFFVG